MIWWVFPYFWKHPLRLIDGLSLIKIGWFCDKFMTLWYSDRWTSMVNLSTIFLSRGSRWRKCSQEELSQDEAWSGGDLNFFWRFDDVYGLRIVIHPLKINMLHNKGLIQMTFLLQMGDFQVQALNFPCKSKQTFLFCPRPPSLWRMTATVWIPSSISLMLHTSKAILESACVAQALVGIGCGHLPGCQWPPGLWHF